MARISGCERPPSLFAWAVFWFARRRLGRVPEPVRIPALHGVVFGGWLGYGSKRVKTGL